MPRDIFEARPSQLAGMIDLDPSGGRLWLPEDLADIFAHRLRVRIDFQPKAGDTLADHGQAGDSALSCCESFADILHRPAPPLNLLTRLRDFAASNQQDSEAPLPPDVATVLFYASLAAGLVRVGQRLTTLEDAKLLAGFLRSAQQ